MGYPKKLLLLIVLILTFHFSGFGQSRRMDSIKSIIHHTGTADSTRINLLLDLAEYYRQTRIPDSTIFYAEWALSLPEQSGKYHQHIQALRLMGASYVIKNDYPTAQTYLDQIVPEEATSDKPTQMEMANALNYKGIVAGYLGDFKQCIRYYEESLIIHKALEDSNAIAGRLTNLGNVHMRLGNYPAAISSLFEAFNYLNEHGSETRAILNLNLGECYILLEDYEKARQQAQKALEGFKSSTQSPVGISESHYILGNVYSKMGLQDSCILHINRGVSVALRANDGDRVAEGHYYLALHYQSNEEWNKVVENAMITYQHFEEVKSPRRYVAALLVLSEAYRKLQETQKSLSLAEKGLSLTRELQLKGTEKDFLILLSRLYASQNNFSTAYQLSLEYSAVKDSVLNQEKTRQIASIEALYENEKREQQLALAVARQKAAQSRLEERKTRELFLIAGLMMTMVVLALGIFLYVTLRQNKKVVDDQNTRLQNLIGTKDRFFSIIGHDLRGPITSFAGINNLIKWYIEKNDEKKLRELGENISKSAEQLDTLLNNLLNWAMAQTEGLPYHPESFLLEPLISEIEALFKNQLKGKNITLVVKITEPIWVLADKNALLLVLRNLVSNALKFTAEKGSIEIVCQQQEEQVIIKVQDSGVGIPKEKLKTLFELNESKSTFGTSNEKGTGLGLILCKEYVSLNKGTITVNSHPGAGTVFTFTLPAYRVTEGEPAIADFNNPFFNT